MNRPATEIFTRALRIESEARAAFLVETCGDDAELLREVEAMLADAARADAYFGDDEAGAFRPADLAPPVSEKPGDVFGPYKLLEQIGEGGFGVVWMAEQSQPILRRVALKVIKAGMDTKQVLARFEAERQALAMMDHPNIARVIDAGATPAGRPYFAMELVKGIPITEFCDQKQLDTRQRLELFCDVCSAVNHAHQKGVIHRDLKPSNILVSRGVDLRSTSATPGGPEVHATQGTAERPRVKVIDFGIAKATEQKLTDKTLFTRFEQFLGTPAYISPEQAALTGTDIDTRSDIYSLGVLLYELLTGTTPFDAQDLLKAGFDEMRRIIRETEPPKPSTRLTQSARTTAKPPVARRFGSLLSVCSPVSLRSAEAAADALPRATPSERASRLAPDHDNPPQERRATGLIAGRSSLPSDLDWIVMKCLEKDRTRRYETANALAADLQRHLTNEPVMARPASKAYRLQKAFRRNKLAFIAAATVAVSLIAGAIVSTWQAIEASRASQRAEKGESAARDSELKARQIAYASDMNLAHQAVKEDDFYRALQLLERHRPAVGQESGDRNQESVSRKPDQPLTPDPRLLTSELRPLTPDPRLLTPDLRGWEWRYLWRQCQGDEHRTLGKHTRSATAVGMLSDGKTVFSAGRDKCVRLWDLESGSQIGELPHEEEVIGAAASPDGRWLATASWKGDKGQPVRLWDLSTKEFVTLTSEYWLRPGSITFSPNSKWLAFATKWKGVRLWDVNARSEVPAAGVFFFIGVELARRCGLLSRQPHAGLQ